GDVTVVAATASVSAEQSTAVGARLRPDRKIDRRLDWYDHVCRRFLALRGSVRSYRAALANLSGGRWGVAQFLWIPRAVEFGLGEDLREAFGRLVDYAASLPQRVDLFRDDLYAVQQRLQQQGGFLLKWRLLRVSLSFVAAILGSYNRTRFT